ncbi:hypothetical protein P7K49_030618 [Saguinus oedipus]|uniref:Uncharacterized protein n=1 Tax=Saguinus oedipus TaxID=9490 RepID=A0ABQ9U2Q3_SAGOE|nr:hypothetical protein P7K49_030618 [Saguinus oedipus]
MGGYPQGLPSQGAIDGEVWDLLPGDTPVPHPVPISSTAAITIISVTVTMELSTITAISAATSVATPTAFAIITIIASFVTATITTTVYLSQTHKPLTGLPPPPLPLQCLPGVTVCFLTAVLTSTSITTTTFIQTAITLTVHSPMCTKEGIYYRLHPEWSVSSSQGTRNRDAHPQLRGGRLSRACLGAARELMVFLEAPIDASACGSEARALKKIAPNCCKACHCHLPATASLPFSKSPGSNLELYQ